MCPCATHIHPLRLCNIHLSWHTQCHISFVRPDPGVSTVTGGGFFGFVRCFKVLGEASVNNKCVLGAAACAAWGSFWEGGAGAAEAGCWRRARRRAMESRRRGQARQRLCGGECAPAVQYRVRWDALASEGNGIDSRSMHRSAACCCHRWRRSARLRTRAAGCSHCWRLARPRRVVPFVCTYTRMRMCVLASGDRAGGVVFKTAGMGSLRVWKVTGQAAVSAEENRWVLRMRGAARRGAWL